MQKITDAIDEAYLIGDTLIFLREYPVENVAMDGRIQSENPKILEATKKIGAGSQNCCISPVNPRISSLHGGRFEARR